MGMLLAFLPFIVFAVVDRLVGAMAGLTAAAVTSAVLVARDIAAPDRSPKLLEVGSALLFGGLALYTWMAGPVWSVIDVRLSVDVGLLAIVLASLALRRPFTLQYARERVPPALRGSSTFVRTNYVITSGWALAFAVMVAAEWAMLYQPDMPRGMGAAVIVLALVTAVKFTGWYPTHVQPQPAQLPGPSITPSSEAG